MAIFLCIIGAAYKQTFLFSTLNRVIFFFFLSFRIIKTPYPVMPDCFRLISIVVYADKNALMLFIYLFFLFAFFFTAYLSKSCLAEPGFVLHALAKRKRSTFRFFFYYYLSFLILSAPPKLYSRWRSSRYDEPKWQAVASYQQD